ncbi:MAG: hypothetical protein HQ515_05660, partial [Phycisphaeraceae bacterium]|nr:hypothetical protein [Phycisphaeraceae bacterium]
MHQRLKPSSLETLWSVRRAKLRRTCLDHVIILNENHLHSVLDEYINDYYNVSRTHMSLEKDSPVSRPVQTNGKIVSKPILGGLHHVYSRV